MDLVIYNTATPYLSIRNNDPTGHAKAQVRVSAGDDDGSTVAITDGNGTRPR